MNVKVVTIPQLSELSGMSQYALRELCKSGQLPFLRLQNRWLIKLEDFNRLFRKEGADSAGE